MLEIFLISLWRALLGFLIILPCATIDRRKLYLSVLTGAILGLISGYYLGVFLEIKYLIVFSVYYCSLFLIGKTSTYLRDTLSGVFSGLGYFFIFQSIGALSKDTALLKENPYIFFISVLGLFIGIGLTYPIVGRIIRALPIEKIFSATSVSLFLGAVLIFIDARDMAIVMESGIRQFLEGLVREVFSSMIISPHEFIKTPLSGLFEFLRGDRLSMVFTVVILLFPPIYILMRFYQVPEPSDNSKGAQKRLRLSFFRKDLIYLSVSPIFAFLSVLISIHTANLALNPLYEPTPIPIKIEDSVSMKIPTTELIDERLRKYIFFYGDKKITLLAVMRPDGNVGLALDECEICPPGKGYGQGKGHLVCIYCMTPIPLNSIGSPSGCNPIPIPFKIEEDFISIQVDALIRVFKASRALKRGGHI